MKNLLFDVELAGNQVASIKHPDDMHRMNWAEGETPWGTLILPDGLECAVHRGLDEDCFRECYTFTNTTPYEMFTGEGEVGIYTTFNDDYLGESYLAERCHAHIWCGGGISYVCALRMGGDAPHLGLLLTKGSLTEYSISRNLEHRSNSRGDFILHPEPFQLAPGESAVVEWELFWHEGVQDFYQRLSRKPNYIHVTASRYVLFSGESAEIHVSGHGPVRLNGQTSDSLIVEASALGTQHYDIESEQMRTSLELLVLPTLDHLSEARCRFIAEKQQYHRADSCLDGAYLAFDNEAKAPVYSHADHDRNGGRERLGMGALMARYLRQRNDPELRASLNQYINYVLRELFDPETGTVYNDAMRNNDWDRLYNSPWMATFFLEVYRLSGELAHLRNAYLALMNYYGKGGTDFSAIDIPMDTAVPELRDAGMKEEADVLLERFRSHCDQILSTGTDYFASEVYYEQSIVAPCADNLLQMYQLTGEPQYLNGAELQVRMLELFNGMQPDYHLHEVAIRHWDGHWFGKRRLYGDTFPHYWSSLTGNVYARMYQITGDTSWYKKAENSLRGSLSAFFPDGSASCANLYPLSVNGQRGKYSDPWANDQDWALYYMMRFYGQIIRSDEIIKRD